ncbi:T9SS type A sorting domain-containing protein [Bacteroidota bacterium]
MNRINFFKAVLNFALLFIIIISSFNLSSYAQDTESAKYFPLAVGNSYTYAVTIMYPPYLLYKFKANITKDTIINGRKYFYSSGMPFVGNGWVRFDTASGNLLKNSPGQGCSIYPDDIILDSLKSKVNDQIYCVFTGSGFTSRRCLDTATMNVFNQYSSKSKNFLHDGLIFGMARYAKNFGIISECTGEPPPCETYKTLTGCVLNGVVYGDTTLSSIKQISSTILEKYTLYQNYPNPFNPVTKIKFDLCNSSQTKLIVYDVLGNEISTLVNENLSAGSYEVNWHGTDYPSGVYFYTLHTGDFKETKKMLLLK